jgi:hypothetical protein
MRLVCGIAEKSEKDPKRSRGFLRTLPAVTTTQRPLVSFAGAARQQLRFQRALGMVLWLALAAVVFGLL